MSAAAADLRLWRSRLEAMAEEVAVGLRGVTGTEEGRRQLETGAGGDVTAIVDRRAEDRVIAACERLAAQGARFLLRSEELGERDFGARRPILLVDPVDGSINAMHGLPFYGVSLALLEGETLGDVAAGVVRNLAGPGLYAAVRGGGAWLDGSPLRPLDTRLEGGLIPMVLVESVRSVAGGSQIRVLAAGCKRVRLLGSTALSLCHVAAGSASGLVAPDGVRAHDCAAAYAVLRESGAVVSDFDGRPIDDRPASLTGAVPVVAARTPEVHGRLLSLLAAG